MPDELRFMTAGTEKRPFEEREFDLSPTNPSISPLVTSCVVAGVICHFDVRFFQWPTLPLSNAVNNNTKSMPV